MKKINEAFRCATCGGNVPIATKTCRNHCPSCFSSRHVDGDIPGERKTSCGGMMYPVAYEQKNSQIRILFVCIDCKKEHWNKQADDDNITELP